MAKNYNFKNDKDREQCAKDFYKDIKMMAAKMSRMLSLPTDELELVCAETLVNCMNEFSNKKFMEKALKENPDMSPEDAEELANSKNDFGKWARTRMRIDCQVFADQNGRIVRLPVNQIRDLMKQSRITGETEVGSTASAYAGVNDRLSLDNLIANSHKEIDDAGDLGAPSDDGDYVTTPSELVDDEGGYDATNTLDDLVSELKARYGKEKGAEEQIDLYREIVMNTLLKDTPDERKKGDIAKEHGRSAAYISGVMKKWSERSKGFFKDRGLM